MRLYDLPTARLRICAHWAGGPPRDYRERSRLIRRHRLEPCGILTGQSVPADGDEAALARHTRPADAEADKARRCGDLPPIRGPLRLEVWSNDGRRTTSDPQTRRRDTGGNPETRRRAARPCVQATALCALMQSVQCSRSSEAPPEAGGQPAWPIAGFRRAMYGSAGAEQPLGPSRSR